MAELNPLNQTDLTRMLGEREILIEQLRQTIIRLEAELAKRDKPEEPAG